MKDTAEYGLNLITIICGLLVIYIGTTEPFSYLNIIIIVGGLALVLLGAMFISVSIKLNKKT